MIKKINSNKILFYIFVFLCVLSYFLFRKDNFDTVVIIMIIISYHSKFMFEETFKSHLSQVNKKIEILLNYQYEKYFNNANTAVGYISKIYNDLGLIQTNYRNGVSPNFDEIRKIKPKLEDTINKYKNNYEMNELYFYRFVGKDNEEFLYMINELITEVGTILFNDQISASDTNTIFKTKLNEVKEKALRLKDNFIKGANNELIL